MYFYQHVLLAGFVCLLLNRKTRVASASFLLGWVIYLFFVIDVATSYKYISCATIEMAIAYYLNKEYRVVAYLGYSLILVNIYGLILYKNGIGPITYDVTYAIISITQFMFLLARAIPNGINRLPDEHYMVRLVNFDSRQTRVIMCKSKATKETDR